EPEGLAGVVASVPLPGGGEVGLPESALFQGLSLDVRFEDRLVTRLLEAEGPPLHGYAIAQEHEIDDGLDALRDYARARIVAAADTAALSLIEVLLERAPDLACTNESARRLVARTLAAPPPKKRSRAKRVHDALRERLLFPGLRGELVSVAQATE